MLSDHLAGVVRALADLPRRQRRILLALLDFLLLLVIVWSLISIRYQRLFVPDTLEATLMIVAAPLLTLISMLSFRVYHIVTRYRGAFGALRLGAYVAIGASVWATIMLIVGQHSVPRSVVLAYIPVATVVVVMIRFIATSLFATIGIKIANHSRASAERIPVVVYGTGHHAVQLGRATVAGGRRKLVGYIDDSRAMAGRSIDGVKVYRLNRLHDLMKSQGVEEIFLADTNSSTSERKLLLEHLQKFRLRVRVIPDMDALTSGRVTPDQLTGVRGVDLLGRDQIPPDTTLLDRAAAGKSILVTGAGGSIGSELAKRLVTLRPQRLVLLEHSEAALFQIEKTIRAHSSECAAKPEIATVLGSVLDAALIADTLERYAVTTVFHAAAYKHVPIVELHPLSGISNNAFGTRVLAEAALEHGVERFVLISTDKAVRPSSVMGATKRLAELTIQALDKRAAHTIFTAVRFGNVLESSGSVVCVFREQINAGGPVTVTDPNVVRYFMSLEEASNLVIQAAGLATGGEIFILDMGTPVRIDDLARSMIRLMGLDVKSAANPGGDIEIRYIGLRPGEKLIEELLISGQNATATMHPRIWRSTEPSLDQDTLERELRLLSAATQTRDPQLAVEILSRVVEGYSAGAQRAHSPATARKVVFH